MGEGRKSTVYLVCLEMAVMRRVYVRPGSMFDTSFIICDHYVSKL